MIQFDNKAFRELRCQKCRALLAYEYIFNGRLTIKCPRCKALNNVNFRAAKSLTTEGEKVEKQDAVKSED